MTAAFILLAHDDLSNAGVLARTLAADGRPVAAHIDQRAGDTDEFDAEAAGADVFRLKRRVCEWGMFGLVEAALDGAAALLRSGADFSHVMLVSGACLPQRPLSELDGFLADNRDVDLIEAVELSERRWVMGGLTDERFRLYHPFSWRKRRALFDRNVDLQRLLRVRRRLPRAVTPALGSQWWCLSRATLQAILDDPQLAEVKRFYRWAWIPDESFFQTMSRRHGRVRIDRSPTLSRFDTEGAPFVFHDDHADLLAASDHFFARKIHPRASELREAAIARAGDRPGSLHFEGKAPETAFKRARDGRLIGREHLISPARLQRLKGEAQRHSAFPYTVVGGVGPETSALISRAASSDGGMICHGRLFGPERAAFAGGDALAPGCLPADAKVRDFWPDQYVINLARGAAGLSCAFCLPVEDRYAIEDFIARDSGATIIWFRGAWALDLYRRSKDADADEIAEDARTAARSERSVLSLFRRSGAALEIRSAALLIDDPAAAVAAIRRAANAAPCAATPAVDFAPPEWSEAQPFLAALRHSGCEIEVGLLEPRGAK